jgi:hypothetical protein
VEGEARVAAAVEDFFSGGVSAGSVMKKFLLILKTWDCCGTF